MHSANAKQSLSYRVAILGSGGREHALAYQIAQSPLCEQVLVLPGNDGMVLDRGIQIASCEIGNKKKVIQELKDNEIDFVVIGPDDLLAQGYADDLEAAGFKVFGPKKQAAKLEWSKSFGKEVCEELGLPIAKHVTIESIEELDHAASKVGSYPLVLKFDGLALGKGVQVCTDEYEAKDFLKQVFEDKKFQRAELASEGPKVVVEEFVTGHEVSLFAVCDGKDFVMLEPACDYKTLLDGNRGKNTGGMGAYSPVPWLSTELFDEISNTVFTKVLAYMQEQRKPFKGLLYAGIMVDGSRYSLLEFNARFGDPETQCILPRLQSDLLPLLIGASSGELKKFVEKNPLRWSNRSCINVVATSPGYPDHTQTGIEVELGQISGTKIYFSGVRKDKKSLITSSGRVFSVSALGDSFQQARDLALSTFEKVGFRGMHYRRDIGLVELTM
ncbi:MAG: phosphoribosylamine--glycine ligase [Bacteriovoracia bacterium]